MSNLTKFQDNWLNKIDYNKNILFNWAAKVPNDPYSCLCNICDCKFLSDKCFGKLTKHAKTLKHRKLVQDKTKSVTVSRYCNKIYTVSN